MISIIVPVYNAEKTIGKCLDSLLSLDHPKDKYEIIIVDDGSTDSTPEILKIYQNIKVLENSKNRGTSYSQNRGVDAASGELIAFLDADDTAPTNWLKAATQYLKDADGVGVYQKPILPDNWLGDHLLYLGKMQFRGDPTKDLIIRTPEKPIYVDAITKPGSLFRKEEILAVGGFNEGLTSGEDIDLCWRLLKEGKKLLLIPDTYISHSMRENLIDFLKQQYWYGRGVAGLFFKHPARMKLMFLFYLTVIVFLADLFWLISADSFFAKGILAVLLISPLAFYLLDVAKAKKGVIWSITHLALGYLKFLANALGIIRETLSFKR